MSQWDYIVVGGGSAGCVLANRLSESQARVLLLEAGGGDRNPYLRIPAGTVKIPRQYDWLYEGEPDPSRDGLVNYWNNGRVIGGGSSVNGMLWVRGNRADFDQWAEMGCRGWEYETILPYYIRGETFEKGADGYRGGNGPQHVSFLRVSHPAAEAFVDSAIAAGFPFNEDYNGKQQIGVGYGQHSQKRGWRHSTARAYLAPALRRRNLTVRKKALVSRVLFHQGRAVGVECVIGPRLERFECTGEVILSAGAIGSPKILMLSGIGPEATLRSYGIDVVVPCPGVGDNLQEHLSAMMIHLMNIPTFNAELSPAAMARHGLEFILRGRGPASAGIAFAVLFGSLDGDDRPSFEVVYAPFGVGGSKAARVTGVSYGEGAHDVHAMQLFPTNSVTAVASVLHPRTRGRVTLRSSDPSDPPRIFHQFAAVNADVAELTAVCRRLREIFQTPPLSHVVAEERVPGNGVETDDQWRAHLRSRTFGGSHPVSTCRMGTDEMAVVDPTLRVHGIEGLRVVDASIMPTIPSGNTNAPTIMIAERGSDLILGRVHQTASRTFGTTGPSR